MSTITYMGRIYKEGDGVDFGTECGAVYRNEG
jgi:hypothetical protein